MNAWRMVWHLAKWDLVRMRWWIVSVSVLLAVQTGVSMRTWTTDPTFWITALGGLLIPLSVIVTVQGDAPLSPDAFYRGRPIRWWAVPVSKMMVLTLAIGVPSLVLAVGPLSQFQEPMPVRLAHLGGIVVGVGALVFGWLCWGAATTSLVACGAVWLASLLVNALASWALHSSAWWSNPEVPWVASLALTIIVAALYRWKWSPRAAATAMLCVTVLESLVSTKSQLYRPGMSRSARSAIIRDSLPMTIDSVSFEQPHVLRVAFHLSTVGRADGVRLSNLFVRTEGLSTVFNLVGANQVSGARVVPSRHSADSISITDASGAGRVEFRMNGMSSSGSGASTTRDLFFSAPDAAGVRHATGVLVVATVDTALSRVQKLSLSGTVATFSATPEGRLSLRAGAAPSRGPVQWHVEQQLAEGRLEWGLVRTSIGAAPPIDESSEDPLFFGHYATRLWRNGRANAEAVSMNGSNSMYSAMILPGLYKRVETLSFTPPPLAARSVDSLEVFRLSAPQRAQVRATFAPATQLGRFP
ncbi:MAG: hypothetical protein K2R93_01100 [Gemmatimonadaceae bacterium]|nr:hypothetical protein [Gemmatimonadaceae bacterium]